MEITKVQCGEVQNSKGYTVGMATITLDDALTVKGLMINKAQDGHLYVAFPARPVRKNGETVKDENDKTKYESFFIASKELYAKINTAVVDAFEEKRTQTTEQNQAPAEATAYHASR